MLPSGLSAKVTKASGVYGLCQRVLKLSYCQCFEVPHHSRRLIKSQRQAAVLKANRGRAVPRIFVNAGVLFERQRGLGIRSPGSGLFLLRLGRLLLIQLIRRFEGCYPVGGREAKVLVKQMEDNGQERTAFFGFVRTTIPRFSSGSNCTIETNPGTPPVCPTSFRPW